MRVKICALGQLTNLKSGSLLIAMEELKVAVVGCGFIGNVHLGAWRRVKGVRVEAVVDVLEERARSASEKFGVPRLYTDYKAVLEDDGIDIVDVCTPTYTHAEITIAAAKSGKHVVCEKPIALRLGEADAMINACRKAGVKFMVAHCLRFWPEYVAVKGILGRGELGEARIARAYRLSGFPAWAPWHRDERLGGGVFVDMSIHDVDFLRWCLGEVDRVYARGGVLGSASSTALDYVHAVIRFKLGAIAFVEGSWVQPPGFPFTTYLEVVGTRGMLTVDNQSTAAVTVYRPGAPPSSFTPYSDDAYYRELEHFASCVREDREPSVTGEEARRTLEVALAAVKSVKTGSPVSLPLGGEVI